MFKELATGIRHFSKGETILSQGADVKYLYLLLSGSCLYNSMIGLLAIFIPVKR